MKGQDILLSPLIYRYQKITNQTLQFNTPY